MDIHNQHSKKFHATAKQLGWSAAIIAGVRPISIRSGGRRRAGVRIHVVRGAVAGVGTYKAAKHLEKRRKRGKANQTASKRKN